MKLPSCSERISQRHPGFSTLASSPGTTLVPVANNSPEYRALCDAAWATRSLRGIPIRLESASAWKSSWPVSSQILTENRMRGLICSSDNHNHGPTPMDAVKYFAWYRYKIDSFSIRFPDTSLHSV